MFVLSNVENAKVKFVLFPDKPVYSIGRLSTDLILKDDLSISRTHVRLHLPKPGSTDALTVEDLSSKYGTYINTDIERNNKMKPKTLTPLQVGDRLRVGALKSIWQLSQLKLVTTTSSLSEQEIKELQQLMKTMGGTVLPSWTDQCSHLTMENVTITVKLLHALLDNKPVVRVEYWRELLKVTRGIHVSEDFPQPENFPPAQAADMPNIKWRLQRANLFVGKTFVFMHRRNFDIYGPVVQKAGGSCKDLNTGVRKPFLTKKNVVVIQYGPSSQSQSSETFNSVQIILEQAGLRLIPDYEIGLAILHCSTEKYCNPSYTFDDYSLPTTESMNSSILIPNTEVSQMDQLQGKASEFFVPESENLGNSDPQSDKLSPKDAEPLASKQLQPLKETPFLTVQRKHINNAVYLDSSDEEVEVVKQTRALPKATETTLKPKRKFVIDSSDEEGQTRNQKKPKSSGLVSPKARPDTAKSVEQKQTGSNLPQRLTRSNQLHQQDMEVAAPSSPRRSLRRRQTPEKVSLPVADKDEDSEDEPLFQFKSKAPNLRASDKDDDSEDEPLFQFKSKAPNARAAHQESEAIEESEKSSLPRSTGSQLAKITVNNFLEKSRNETTETVPLSAAQPRKRLRLVPLNESDSDNDEELFTFGVSKKPRRSSDQDSDSNDRNMFNFNTTAQQDDNSDQDAICTEPFIPATKNTSKYTLLQPKQPFKINVSGWLSCSRLHEDVKPEASPVESIAVPVQSDIKEEAEDEDDKLDINWAASLADSIKVRMCNLNITSRLREKTDTTDSRYDGRKNFKKFVKNSNLHPQQRVLELKRMQLAEGTVSSL